MGMAQTNNLAIFGLLLFQSCMAESGLRPNIVLILADDMGYGDLGANTDGSASETPNLDTLALNGIRFSDMHAGSSVCSPARAALLSGRLGIRTGMVNNFGEASLYGLSLNEILLPKLLADAGYSTMALGKWHLGHQLNYLPSSRGFDHWLGIPYSWDMGCADGENGIDWFDNFCASASFRLGCPKMWYDDAMCSGASAHSPGIPLFQDDVIVEQPTNLSSVASTLDEAAFQFIASFGQPFVNKKTLTKTKTSPVSSSSYQVRSMKSNKIKDIDSQNDVKEKEFHLSSKYLRSFPTPSKSIKIDKKTDEKGEEEEEEEEEENDVDDVPFFLYYATPHMHAPMAYAPVFKDTSTSKSVYGDALRELDNSVGLVMRALDQFNLSESTLVIFTSDNGPWNIKGDWTLNGNDCVVSLPFNGSAGGLSGNQGPFDGSWQKAVGGSTGKFTPWEGGHRVPTIFSWPNTLPSQTYLEKSLLNSGSANDDVADRLGVSLGDWLKPERSKYNGEQKGLVSDILLSHFDLLPTLVALSGAALPSDRIYDGVDLVPLFTWFKEEINQQIQIRIENQNQNQNENDQMKSMKKQAKIMGKTLLDNVELFELPKIVNDLNSRVLFHPGDDQQEIYAVRLGIETKVFVRTGSAARCGEAYYTDGHTGNETLVFDISSDLAEAYPSQANSSSLTQAASVAAFAALEALNASIIPGLQSYSNFSEGRQPEAWPCADSTQLSCRLGTNTFP